MKATTKFPQVHLEINQNSSYCKKKKPVLLKDEDAFKLLHLKRNTFF